MDLKKLLKFIEDEDKRLKKHYGHFKDREKEVFAMAVKLSEEVGELSEALLFQHSLQGKHKKKKEAEINLAHEFADVILATLLLAKNEGIDIKKALTEKTKYIEKRYKDFK